VQSPDLHDGNGATYNLTAGTARPGEVGILGGDLDASAGLSGNGGTINIKMNSDEAFEINNGPVSNGIDGALLARGGTFSPTGVLTGNGGTITVQNLGTGGMVIGSTSSIDVSATAGNGGHISLSSPSGRLLSAPGTLSADAAGSGDFAGGTIS